MRSAHLGDNAALYALGTLDADANARVEQHVARCGRCTRDLGTAEASIAALDRITARHVPPERLARRIEISARVTHRRNEVNISRATAVIAGLVIATSGIGAAAVTPHRPIAVHIKNFKFRPTPLRVHVGDVVTFVNDDDDAHTVTAANKSFDSGGLDTKQSWKHTFTKAGTYAYFCSLHPYMKASVVVTR